MQDPVIAQKNPCRVQLQAGSEYWWCACGRSKTQPFCDGSHKGTGIEPLRFVAQSDGEQALCCCKQTATPPYCDGSHRKLQD